VTFEARGARHEARDEGAKRGATARALGCACAVAVLAACGTAPTRQPSAEAPRPQTPSKPGGYYLDDGPHANPPENLDQVPDAQPKPEPIRAANARPYTALGRTYVPMTALGPYQATGLASWYGKRYHGRLTASGEIYDMYAMTAAHPTLPIPSYVQVTSVATQRVVVVRINDRGPFHSDRLIDLSYVAAYKLGILASGSAMVEVKSILPAEMVAAATPQREPLAAPPAAGASAAAPAAEQPSGVYVQVGAFNQRENAASLLTRLQAELGALAERAGIYQSGGVYRVQAGPYTDRESALQAAARIEQAFALKPVVITR
jgi:rare lipoprotein A